MYNKIVDTISNFFKDVKNNSLFLFKIALGFVLATILGSKVLYFLFKQYELYLKVIFAILILTGVPELLRKSKTILAVFIISIVIYIILTSVNSLIYDCDINYFIAGVVESLSTIVPGISGTSIYLNLGWYDEILVMFSNLYLFELSKIIPFFASFAVVSLIIIRLIDWVMKKYENFFYSFVCSLMIISIILMF